MAPILNKKVSPAPARESVSTPNIISHQNWKLLEYLNYYRLVIAASVSFLALTTTKLPLIGQSHPQLFLIVGLLYVFVSGFSLTTIHYRRPSFNTQSTVLIFCDVVALSLLVHASGGITSGIGLLLLISIAGSSFLMDQRMTILFASLAAISMLLENSWELLQQLLWETKGETLAISAATLRGYPQAGLLGLALFATGFLANNLAGRLRDTEALAEQRGTDITNLENLNALIIQRLEAGIIVCDPIGHIHMINQPAKKFLDIKDEPGHDALLSDLSPQLANLLFAWLDQEKPQTPNSIRLPSGYTVLPKLSPLGDGEDSGILIMLEDVAVQKLHAQQVKMAALARLTAGIAHEIRNPLGAIRNAAQLLGETTHDKQDARLVEIINNHSIRMNHIIENISELGRRDRAQPQTLELQGWVEEFVQQLLLTVELPAVAIELKLMANLYISMDPDQLYQIINNLCQNAIRHSPDYTDKPVIQIATGLDGHGMPFLTVTDWGEGIPTEIRDHIFEPFYTTASKGTGLGLYISRELCEANNGYINYLPGENDLGSRFHITFTKADVIISGAGTA